MDSRYFKAEWDKISVQNVTMRITMAALVVALIAQTLVIVALYNKQRVVFVPPKVDREFYIAGDVPSTSYLEMMGEFLGDKLMNFTSSNVLSRFNSVLPFLSPANYNDIKTLLARQAESITKANISQVFFFSKAEVNEKFHTIGVQGSIRRIVVDQVSAEKPAILWIQYGFKGGKFEVNSITVSTESNKNPYDPANAAVAGK